MWYASRTLFLIENEYRKFAVMLEDRDLSKSGYVMRLASLQSILKEAKSYLEEAFKTSAYNFLTKSALRPARGETYFRDFLGLNDTDLFGKPIQRDEVCPEIKKNYIITKILSSGFILFVRTLCLAPLRL